MFFEKGPKGGVISDPKNYIADFVGFKAVYFGRKFWKKCPKRGERGGSSPFGNFPKKHPYLGRRSPLRNIPMNAAVLPHKN